MCLSFVLLAFLSVFKILFSVQVSYWSWIWSSSVFGLFVFAFLFFFTCWFAFGCLDLFLLFVQDCICLFVFFSALCVCFYFCSVTFLSFVLAFVCFGSVLFLLFVFCSNPDLEGLGSQGRGEAWSPMIVPIQATGPPENFRLQGIVISVSSPEGLISAPGSSQLPTRSSAGCL